MPTPTAITPPPARSSTKTYQAAQQSNTHDNNAVPTDWSTLGTPELHQPKVREALAQQSSSNNSPSDPVSLGTPERLQPTVVTPHAETETAVEAVEESISLSTVLRAYGERIIPSLGATSALNKVAGQLITPLVKALPHGTQFIARAWIGDFTARPAWHVFKVPQDMLEREIGIEPVDPSLEFFQEDDLGPGLFSAAASIKTSEMIAKALGPAAMQTLGGFAKVLMGSTAVSSAVFVTADTLAQALNQTEFVKDSRADLFEFLGDMATRVTSDTVVPDPQDFLGPNGQPPEQFDEWHLPTDPAAYLAVYDAFHGIDRMAQEQAQAELYDVWEATYQVDGMPRVDAISFAEFKAQYESAQASLYDVPHPGDEAGAIQAWLENSVASVKDTLVLDEALRVDEPIDVSVLPPVPSAPAVFSGLLQTDTALALDVPPVVFVSSRTDAPTTPTRSEYQETDDGDSNKLIGGLPSDCLIELWMVPYIARLLALGETDLCRFNDWDVNQLEAYLAKHEPAAADSTAAEVEYDGATGLPLVVFASSRTLASEDESETDESELPSGAHFA